ncbi:BP74-related protein [Bdellovibrio sp. GT3]|uniref:BP74-related protein n=1 Tax=Bdellovibrio sp. GT3 TaxID=3136282 RepID=UPI0030F1AA9C
MQIKPLSLIIGALLFNHAALAAETFYVPGFCPREDIKILVQNKSQEPEKWWTQVHMNGGVKERYQEIEAHSEMKIAGSAFLSDDRGFSLKAATAGALKFTAICEEQKILLSSVTSPQVTHYLPAGQTSVKMSLLNLYLKSIDVTLKSYDLAGVQLEEKSLRISTHYDTANLKWSFNRSVARIEIASSGRLHSEVFYGDDLKQSPPLALTPIPLEVDAGKKYFMISTKSPSENGSYVIGLDDSETIATAREQIQNPDLEKIVVARIALSPGLSVNRNFQARDKSPYSWNVTHVDSFGDFAHLDCDGNPDLVEERLQQRLSEGGRICFWRYRVVRELTPLEVSSGLLNP